MPQFSLKRLLASTGMIAVGCAMLLCLQRRNQLNQGSYTHALIFFCALAGPSMIGAGIGNIFRRAAYGMLFAWLALLTGLVAYFLL
jgi:hypothetical protein